MSSTPRLREGGQPGGVASGPAGVEVDGVGPVAVVEVVGVGGREQHGRPEAVAAVEDAPADVEDGAGAHRCGGRVEEGEAAGGEGLAGRCRERVEGDGVAAAGQGQAQVGGGGGPGRHDPADGVGHRRQGRRPRRPPGPGDHQEPPITPQDQGVDRDEEGVGAVAVEPGEQDDLGGEVDGFGAPGGVGGHATTVADTAGQPLDGGWTATPAERDQRIAGCVESRIAVGPRPVRPERSRRLGADPVFGAERVEFRRHSHR